VTDQFGTTLELARRECGLSGDELWFRYFGLGGMSTAFQLDAYLHGALEPSDHDHDLIAHALNERFVELGRNHPVPYLEDGDLSSSES
jgi:urocanate hydratase